MNLKNQTDFQVSKERLVAAAKIRELSHEIVSHDIDPPIFNRISSFIDEITPEIVSSPRRSRPVEEMKRTAFLIEPRDGETTEHFPDCIVSGPANPMGVAAQGYRDKQEAVVKVALGEAFEGAPGRAHGGIVAALFDDTMGFVLNIMKTPAYTGNLSVKYLAPTPVKSEIEFRGRCVKKDGRKIYMTAEATSDGKTIATAEALFITVTSEKFHSGS